MNIKQLKQLALAVALLGTVTLASAADNRDAGSKPITPEGGQTAQALQPAAQAKSVLTREQVLEDLKRYQHEHANPSYAELVFLR